MPRPRPTPLATLLCATLLLAACAAAQPPTMVPLPTAAPATRAPRQRPTPASDPTAPAVLAQPSGLPTASVVEVIDGDTVDVRLNGRIVWLRLIGIDTPEIKDPRRPVECFGQEASAHAHALLDGQSVALEADASQGETDRYGRTLRYVWLMDGRLFNQVMIAEGYAFEYTYNLPYTYQAAFQDAQHAAREQQRGLWAPTTCAGEHRPVESAPAATNVPAAPTPAPAQPPILAPAPTVPAAPTARAGRCDPAYPGVCIPPAPPDLDCADVPFKRFTVLPPDPHRFDADHDSIGCER